MGNESAAKYYRSSRKALTGGAIPRLCRREGNRQNREREGCIDAIRASERPERIQGGQRTLLLRFSDEEALKVRDGAARVHAIRGRESTYSMHDSGRSALAGREYRQNMSLYIHRVADKQGAAVGRQRQRREEVLGHEDSSRNIQSNPAAELSPCVRFRFMYAYCIYHYLLCLI